MDCRQFDRIVVDLASKRIGDATTQERGLDHARRCSQCGTRLADQRRLTAALGDLRIAGAGEEAPERVEEALVRALRTCWEHPKPAIAMDRSLPRPRVRGWKLWTGAASAAALLLALSLAWKLQPTKLRVKPVEQESSSHLSRKASASAAVEESRQSGAASGLASQQARRPTKRASSPRSFTTPDGTAETEVTTRFYPLPYGSGLGLDEGWTMVRVRVRRSSLASLGVPVYPGSAAGEMLTADVVVGQDGLARGIRFVQ
jgi:hypothetical protein